MLPQGGCAEARAKECVLRLVACHYLEAATRGQTQTPQRRKQAAQMRLHTLVSKSLCNAAGVLWKKQCTSLRSEPRGESGAGTATSEQRPCHIVGKHVCSGRGVELAKLGRKVEQRVKAVCGVAQGLFSVLTRQSKGKRPPTNDTATVEGHYCRTSGHVGDVRLVVECSVAMFSVAFSGRFVAGLRPCAIDVGGLGGNDPLKEVWRPWRLSQKRQASPIA